MFPPVGRMMIVSGAHATKAQTLIVAIGFCLFVAIWVIAGEVLKRPNKGEEDGD